MSTHWHYLANTIETNLCFLRPTWVHNPNSKSIGSAIFAQLTAECRRACHFPWKLPLRMGIWTPSNMLSGAYLSKSQTASRLVEPFLHSSWQCCYTLQWDVPLQLKITPSQRGFGTPSNTWFLGSTRVNNPNGISIGSAVFAGITSVTEWQTDHTTQSVTTGHIVVLRCGLINYFENKSYFNTC